VIVKIVKVETIELDHSTVCYGGWLSWLWVRIHTDSGLIGLGETYPSAASEKPIILNDLAPILLGRDATEIEALWHDMLLRVHPRGWAGAEMRAISAIDMALWDLLGKVTGQPLYVLLGGKCRETVPIYNTCYDDAYDFNEKPAELAKDLYAAGITAMKIWPFDSVGIKNRGQHISRDEMDQCMGPVRKIREALGDRMEIAMEFHGLWNLPCAIKIARELEPYHVMWLEEILGQDNLMAYKTLSEHTSQPLCVSERLYTRWGYRELIESRAASIIMLDVGWTGGLTEAKKIANWAETYYLPIAPHDCGGPVSHHAVWHLSVATPNLMIMETVRRHYESLYGKIATQAGAVSGGKLGLPEGPGLGVELRPEFLSGADVRIESVGGKPAR
jgi:galactonate dehydratase